MGTRPVIIVIFQIQGALVSEKPRKRLSDKFDLTNAGRNQVEEPAPGIRPATGSKNKRIPIYMF